MKTKIAVLVSGGGTNLQALLDAMEAGNIPSGEIVTVISSAEGAYALTRAENHGIPHVAIPCKTMSQKLFEQRLSEELEKAGAELIVLAGFVAILSRDFVSRWPNRIINIHPSLIPSFCGQGMYGIKVHAAALHKGVKVTGATVHFVNEIPDDGEIIMQKAVEVLPGDTPQILQKRVMEQAEWIMLPQATELIAKKIMEGK